MKFCLIYPCCCSMHSPCTQGWAAQWSVPERHRRPWVLGGHRQWNALTLSIQVPPLLQGFELHSLISTSHLSPIRGQFRVCWAMCISLQNNAYASIDINSFNLLFSKICFKIPVYPGEHKHLYSLMPSWHSPYWQRLLAQSSSLISQFTPGKIQWQLISK